MIIDTLDRIGLYRCLNGHFRTAIDFLLRADLGALSLGRIEIDGEDVYAIASEQVLSAENQTWEAHARYADMQIILSGAERFGWAPAGGEIPETFDAAKDFCACSGARGFDFSLSGGEFAVFFPGEAHRPNNPAGEMSESIKLILKVKMGE